MKLSRFVSVSFVMLILIGTAYSVSAQDSNMPLREKRITLHVIKQPLATVFKLLMQNYGLTIGFEESTFDRNDNDYAFDTNLPNVGVTAGETDEGKQFIVEAEQVYVPKHHWLTIDAENQKLGEVFDVLVQQMNNYKWEINDGVINIFPSHGRGQRYENLMELRIRSFSLAEGSRVGQITDSFLKLPELIHFLSKNKLFYNGGRVGLDVILDRQLNRKLDAKLDYTNLTFRSLLNEITKVKKGGWIVKKSRLYGSSEKEFIDIDI